MSTQYIRLVDLCQRWGNETGELDAIILSRLIGWANEGEFPKGSFFRPDGRAVASKDLFDAWCSVEGIALVGRPAWPPGEAKSLIQEVLVKRDAVRSFCVAHSLRPPVTVGRMAAAGAALKGHARVPPEPPAVEASQVVGPVSRLAVLEEAGLLEPDAIADNNESATSAVTTVGAETKCRQWIEERAAAGNAPANRNALFKEAHKKFRKTLSRRGFDRAWAVAAPDEWKKPGRKSRRRIDTPN